MQPQNTTLANHFKRLRRSGHGWIALCPAHSDNHHSLSITPKEGRYLVHCFVGCDWRDVLCAAGLSPGDMLLDEAARKAAAAATMGQRIAKARVLWAKTLPARGTLVDRCYLRHRGISVSIPVALRFAPLVEHYEFGWPFPAMVAGVQDVAGNFRAIQLTYLAAHGCDKAPVSPERKIFGPMGNGAVRLAPPAESV